MFPTHEEIEMSELRRRMQEAMILRGFSERTQEAYIAGVAGLAKYAHRSPEVLEVPEIQRYLLHLITERKLAYASVNQAVCAIRFLFGEVLGKPDIRLAIPMAKVPKRLPMVFSREQVMQLFAHARNQRDRTLLETVYASGLRLSEVCALELSDIESATDRMCLPARSASRARHGFAGWAAPTGADRS